MFVINCFELFLTDAYRTLVVFLFKRTRVHILYVCVFISLSGSVCVCAE